MRQWLHLISSRELNGRDNVLPAKRRLFSGTLHILISGRGCGCSRDHSQYLIFEAVSFPITENAWRYAIVHEVSVCLPSQTLRGARNLFFRLIYDKTLVECRVKRDVGICNFY